MATLITFTAGTPILSADVNANFEALNTAVAAIAPTGVGEIAVGDGATTRLATGTSILTFVHTGTLAAGEDMHLGYKEAVNHADVAWAVPFACVIQGLRVRANTAPGLGQTLVFTVFEGGAGSATAVTATISGNNSSAFDLTNTETVTAGSLLSVEVVASAGAASSTGVRCTLAVAPR